MLQGDIKIAAQGLLGCHHFQHISFQVCRVAIQKAYPLKAAHAAQAAEQ